MEVGSRGDADTITALEAAVSQAQTDSDSHAAAYAQLFPLQGDAYLKTAGALSGVLSEAQQALASAASPESVRLPTLDEMRALPGDELARLVSGLFAEITVSKGVRGRHSGGQPKRVRCWLTGERVPEPTEAS